MVREFLNQKASELHVRDNLNGMAKFLYSTVEPLCKDTPEILAGHYAWSRLDRVVYKITLGLK